MFLIHEYDWHGPRHSDTPKLRTGSRYYLTLDQWLGTKGFRLRADAPQWDELPGDDESRQCFRPRWIVHYPRGWSWGTHQSLRSYTNRCWGIATNIEEMYTDGGFPVFRADSQQTAMLFNTIMSITKMSPRDAEYYFARPPGHLESIDEHDPELLLEQAYNEGMAQGWDRMKEFYQLTSARVVSDSLGGKLATRPLPLELLWYHPNLGAGSRTKLAQLLKSSDLGWDEATGSSSRIALSTKETQGHQSFLGKSGGVFWQGSRLDMVSASVTAYLYHHGRPASSKATHLKKKLTRTSEGLATTPVATMNQMPSAFGMPGRPTLKKKSQ